ncbi:myosin light chain kinase, smooth muscle isoform X2 [Octopus bimaculoides]|uniref:myosin light chain kinase, smooth muscle isoform X2 n=1 Tax=Octopus bimaculoides TaxID=37653 RepID=UPI00071E1667|nr:myosin light chain kinase, smooth muscle isoform X2 [Octopus bimaculoides]|eukprot:XP_014785560.1 PREDICTED: myosin light chain kinase, smooth muscle-like isoform X2 [Octopus bimaculoides]
MNGLNTSPDINADDPPKIHVDEDDPIAELENTFDASGVTIKTDLWVTDNYEISDVLLGRGKFGEVKVCTERQTGQEFAAKFLSVRGMQGRKDIRNEIDIMKSLRHPRLLQMYDAYERRDKFCLILELVSGGELFERVINEDFYLTERACVIFLRQICEGVEFIHSKNILHLDMKPENILCMTRTGNRIKIIDFGLARRFDPRDDMRVLFGTPEFIAPEVVNFEPISHRTDMWSVGVITYILLSGLSPFLGDNDNQTLSNVTCAQWDFDAEEFESISAEAKDFITKLLVKRPTKRLSATDCLEHTWLKDAVSNVNPWDEAYRDHLKDTCDYALPFLNRSTSETASHDRTLSKKRLKKFVSRRKWQKATNAMVALKRMGVRLV